MSTRDIQRLQFAFTAALSLHALAAVGMIEYSRSLAKSDAILVASVMNVAWEVDSKVESEAESEAKNTEPQAAPKKSISKSETPTATQAVSTPAAAEKTSGAPNPQVMQSYLAALRDRLGNAIHLHQPKGTVGSQLVLKVAISSSGAVGKSEIEKSSENADVDHAVLAAFSSLLPLPPFPEEWKSAPQIITVRIPVVIRPGN